MFLDIVDNRDKDTLNIYRYARHHEWECVTSIFAKVETLEVKQFHVFKSEKRKLGWSTRRIEQERNNRDLTRRILGNISRSLTGRLKYRGAGFREYSSLVEDGWVKAEEVKRKTNLTDKDSIHLAEALAIACDIFITRDRHLLSVAKRYIWAEQPNSIIKFLSQ